jgi:hypothetical protein
MSAGIQARSRERWRISVRNVDVAAAPVQGAIGQPMRSTGRIQGTALAKLSLPARAPPGVCPEILRNGPAGRECYRSRAGRAFARRRVAPPVMGRRRAASRPVTRERRHRLAAARWPVVALVRRVAVRRLAGRRAREARAVGATRNTGAALPAASVEALDADLVAAACRAWIGVWPRRIGLHRATDEEHDQSKPTHARS